MMAVFKQAELLLMLAFVAALVLYFTLKLWLNMRQIRFIMAHQHQVPPPFDRRIDLRRIKIRSLRVCGNCVWRDWACLSALRCC